MAENKTYIKNETINQVVSDRVKEEEPTVKPLDEAMGFVIKRVDSLKPTSAAYRYYKNTPLQELKSREEKLIKKEIERRERDFNVLQEQDPSVTYAKTSDEVPSAWQYAYEKEKENPSASDELKPWRQEVATKPLNATEDVSIFSQIMTFITSIPDKFMSYFSEGSALHTAYKNIIDYIHGISNKVFGENGPSKETVETSVQYTFITAAAILALVACWKLVKRFVNKDGEVITPTAADASVATAESIEASLDNSYGALALINEDSSENPSKSIIGSHVKQYADKMLADLLADEQFVKYMSKNNPKLLDFF